MGQIKVRCHTTFFRMYEEETSITFKDIPAKDAKLEPIHERHQTNTNQRTIIQITGLYPSSMSKIKRQGKRQKLVQIKGVFERHDKSAQSGSPAVKGTTGVT